MDWNSPKACINVDEDTMSMKVEGRIVVTASVKEDKFEVKWEDENWADCRELQTSQELAIITSKANERFAKSRVHYSKHAGKE